MKVNRRTAIKITAAGVGSLALTPDFFAAREAVQPFGADFKNLETLTTGRWWTKGAGTKTELKGRRRRASAPPMGRKVAAEAVLLVSSVRKLMASVPATTLAAASRPRPPAPPPALAIALALLSRFPRPGFPGRDRSSSFENLWVDVEIFFFQIVVVHHIKGELVRATLLALSFFLVEGLDLGDGLLHLLHAAEFRLHLRQFWTIIS